jgi:hypothetical protein
MTEYIRAVEQPSSVEIKLTDDLFIKTALVKDAGTVIPTHAHAWDHVTLLAVGQVIGDGLRSRIDERRVTEVNVAVDIINRMRELGRPNYVRII